MPATLTYPGVYIQELKSGVHTITGVATSIAAFVGYTARGLDQRATQIFSFADYERSFGGLAADSELSYGVQQFFQNGGSNAIIVRVPKVKSTAASVNLLSGVVAGSAVSLTVTMLSNGTWSDQVVIEVDDDGIAATDLKGFNLTVTDLATGTVETFDKVSMDSAKNNFVENVVNDEDSGSQLIKVTATPGSDRPVATGFTGGDITLTDVKNDQAYTIKLITDVPSKSVEFMVIGKTDPVPASIASLCRLFARRATDALSAVIPKASVQCVPSSDGKGLRVVALIPDAYDTQVTFASGTTADADTFLKLTPANGSANVAHYWPNSKRTTTILGADPTAVFAQALGKRGSDGTGLPDAAGLIGDPSQFQGLYALDKVDLFNLLCLPDVTRAQAGHPNVSDLDATSQNAVLSAAMAYCEQRRAFLLVDAPPEVRNVPSAVDWKTSGLKVHDTNGAAYFPRLKLPDPLNDFQWRAFAPCGVVAGLYARTDATRGVWKAPAGIETTLTGVQGLAYQLTDAENGALNPLGVNCLRIFPVYGAVAWGARTLVGADADANEWKYVPVRRFALFLEESLYRGTQWVIFEPNDERLWSQIRLNLGAFMQTLFRQGAFQGSTPRDAYFVKCDKDTTTQNDIDAGVVNVVVGFAALKPAEFVVIQIQQIAGQLAV